MDVGVAVDVDRHLRGRGVGDVRRLLVVDVLEESGFVGRGQGFLDAVFANRPDLHRGKQRSRVDLDLGARREAAAIARDQHVRSLPEREVTGHEPTDFGVLDDQVVGTGRMLVSVDDRGQRVARTRRVGVASTSGKSESSSQQNGNDALVHTHLTLPDPLRFNTLLRLVSDTKRNSATFAGMSQQVRGIIARAKGEPVTMETIVIPDPGPGEAVVVIQACGVCHTDLHYREGGINDEFPFLLGHEAAGVVESVGEGVTDVVPGDYVILNWRAVCGDCRACRRGEAQYCFNTHNATQKMTLTDGTELSAALGIGAFCDKTLVAAGQCTKVDPAASPAAAGLLGCGVMAGIGATLNTAGVTRGQSVAVFGCGGVGDAAIAGARLAGASTIIGVDIDDRKLEWAQGFGATHVCNSKETDPVEFIRSVTDGFGADVCIEAIGHPEVYKQAFEARDLAGTVVLVGVPNPEMTLELPFIDVFGRGGALKSSWYGDCLPSRDFPMLIDLYLQGRLDLDGFVSETIGLDGVEEAFHKMERGEVLRSVVVF